MLKRTCILAIAAILLTSNPMFAQREFGFDNTKPSGQPYLPPDETVKRFTAAPGYEVKLFAGEPDVINPIAFTIDKKGRLWVVECFEYPSRTPKGKKPRDRIKILEDTNGDGQCDKVTVWAEGKSLPIGWDLASGIEVGNGGVYLGAPPYLFFLQDTDGDGKCDKQEVLLKGFGSHDTHETLNTFQWGPDGQLYGLHGVFTQSVVDGVRLNAAVWRYDPFSKKFEVFAEGTSNPWGMDFDSYGQCHLVCCVIPHMFHIVPGGTYIRQAGASFNPYAYGLLKQSCDHTHHKESGWAHAGLLFLDGDHVPEAYRGSLIMGSIHGCSIKRDTLRPNGSTFIAGHAPDFITSGDKNFRPINLRWGPDGSIYVIDWHDQNPCHQAHPDSWDKERGRIYRIQREGHKVTLPGDVAKRSSKELVQLLENDNPWWYRTALRLLNERRDQSVREDLLQVVRTSKNVPHILRAMWGLHAIGTFDEKIADQTLQHSSPWVRSWAIRLIAERGGPSEQMMNKLTMLAAKEPAPEVRLQLAAMAQKLEGKNVVPLLHNLMKHKKDAADPFIPLMIWLAYEPHVPTTQREPVLKWLAANAPGNPLVTEEVVPRTIRRLAASGKAEDLAAAIDFLAAVEDSTIRERALQGMTEALAAKKVHPPAAWKIVFSSLSQDPSDRVRQLARKIAVNFQDPGAVRLALAAAKDSSKPEAHRVDALRDIAVAQTPETLPLLIRLIEDAEEKIAVRAEAIRALSHFDDRQIAEKTLAAWESFPPRLRNEAVNMLAGRKPWARALLRAVAEKKIARGDVTNNAILRIHAFNDAKLNEMIETVWGRFRKTPAELEELINKTYDGLDQTPSSYARGHKVFENQCSKCHKFQGKGFEVGPPLDGASREIDYLIVNVLDPNRVVGQPYYTRLVELKNGRLETGLLVAEDKDSITLKGENDAVKVIQRTDIAGDVLVQPKSVMPEGLANNMTAQDFRDLIRYLMVHPFLTNVQMCDSLPTINGNGTVQLPDLLKHLANNARACKVGVTGRIALPAGNGNTENGAIIGTEFKSAEAWNTELLLGSTANLQVWLNGKKVYHGTPNTTRDAPDQVRLVVNLQKGENRLLILARYRDDAAIYARFHDPDRRIVQEDFQE